MNNLSAAGVYLAILDEIDRHPFNPFWRIALRMVCKLLDEDEE